MKIHVGWLVFCVVLCLSLQGAYALFLKSSIPAYWEAEPLVSPAMELSRELAAITKERELELADLKHLLSQDRFSKIKPYGIILSTDPAYSVSIPVNRTFHFKLMKEGYLEWEYTK